MGQIDRHRGLEQRRSAAFDRIVVVCNATGRLVALVQVSGKGPARLVMEHDDVLLQSAPNGTTARCRCAAGKHALDVYRFQSEVFKQTNDPTARRPIRITV